MEYPCATCTRCKDPENCGNKTCKEWREWFIERWDAMRRNAGIERRNK